MIKSCSCTTPYEYIERNIKTGEKVFTGHCLNCNGYVKTGGLTMKTAKHTPTPWTWEEQFLPEDLGKSNGTWIVANHYPLASMVETNNFKANADHIVHCVNCHDELVDALKSIDLLLPAIDISNNTSSVIELLRKNALNIKQALAKAEEE